MKTTIRTMMVFLVLGVLMSISAFAAITGANITNGSVQTGSGTSATNVTISGGEVREVNVTGDSITTKWAGFYGNIAGGIALTDGTNKFYNWTVTNVTGSAVFAANQTISSWAGLAAASDADMPSYLTDGATDNFTNTFQATDAFNSSSNDIATVPTVTTNGGAGLQTFALKADGALVWGAEAKEDVTGFNTNQVDYQLLVPAQTNTVYTFYMELP